MPRFCLSYLAGAAVALLAAPAPASFLTYAGTTLGGPTFNRPIDNGPFAPTDLSGIGTAVPYQAETFTVAETGNYDISSFADFDNYAVLYQGAFDPLAPLTNAVIANDDEPVFNIGTSGFLNVGLTAGESYTLVTTGYANPDAGNFVNAIAGQSALSAGVTDGSGPTLDLFGFGPAPYTVTEFAVTADGAYNFFGAADYDNVIVLYDGAFDPADVNANLITFNDDYFFIGQSGLLGVSLEAGRSYVLLDAGFGAGSFGAFATTISGPGALVAAEVVPVPPTLAAAGVAAALGLGGRLARRGRHAV